MIKICQQETRKMKKALHFILMLTALIGASNSTYAQFTTKGKAVRTTQHCFRVTEDKNSQLGAVWFDQKIDLSQAVNLEFNIFMGDKDNNGADGIGFVMHNDPRGLEALGDAGGGLGFGAHPSQGGRKISPSVAVEFDTWRNGQCRVQPNEDPQEDHTTVVYNGDMCSPQFPPVRLKPNPPYTNDNVEDNKCYNYRILWDPVSENLSLYIENTLVFSHTDDVIDKVFGGETEVYYGFTGSTGGSRNEQTVCIIGNNTTPVAEDDQATTTEDNAINIDVLANDSDDDGDAVYVTGITQNPSHGSVSIDDGQITYTPALGFVGTDEFVYEACDIQPVACYANCDRATVTVQVNRDGASCAISANAQAESTSCLTASDGKITVTVSGGVNPFKYAWNTGSTAEALTNLTPGTYEVTITDAVGCQTIATTTVAASDQRCPRVKRLQLQPLCSDNADELRWVITNPNGATVEAEYRVGTEGPRTSVTALPGETYLTTAAQAGNEVRVYWKNQVGEENSARRKSPQKRCSCILSFELTPTNAACEAATGKVVVNNLEGSGRYRYAWSNGATSKNLNKIPPGVYSLTITDRGTEAECSITREVTIGITSPKITLSIAQPLSCDDASDGRVRTKVSGGKGPYRFLWEHGATTRNLNQLTAGEYTLTVTDANGCQNTASITMSRSGQPCIAPLLLTARCSDDETKRQWQVSNPNNTSVSYQYEVVNDLTQNGTLTVAANSSSQFSTTSAPGANKVRISWQDEQQIERSRTKNSIRQRCSCVLAYDLEAKAASCDEANGRIKLRITEGSGRYGFLWSTGATTRDLNNVSAGTYSVTVTDKSTEASCIVTKEIVVPSAAPVLSVSLADPLSCDDAQDARVTSTVTGGQAPYTYQWDSGQVTTDLNNVGAGNYTLTVIDASGCEVSEQIQVVAPGTPCQVVSSLNLTSFCNDDLSQRRWRVKNPNDFPVEVTYEVVGQTEQTGVVMATSGDTFFFTNDVGGANTVKIYWEDENGSTQSKVKAASNQQCNCQLDYELIATDTNCELANGGGVRLQINKGSGNYRYAWSNGATTQNLENVPTGTYSVTVTDRGTQEGCEITQEVVVASSKPTVTFSIDAPLSCDDAQDASISCVVTGGQAPYSYQMSGGPYTYRWTGGINTANYDDLSALTYTLTVTDASGCEVSEQIQIAAPGKSCQTVAPLNLTSFCDDDLSQRRWRVKNPNDFGVKVTYEVVGDASQTAEVTAQPSGDTFFYTQAVGGANTVKIYWEDETGIRKSKVKAASNQQCSCQLAYELIATDVGCDDSNSGGATLTIDEGSGNYRYLWNTGATTQNLTNVPAGTYSVTVTDRGTQEDCAITQEIEIRSSAPTVNLSVANPLSCDEADDARIESAITGGQSPYTYQWDAGPTTASLNDVSAGSYTLTVTDAQGCTVSQSIEVVAPGSTCQVIDGLNLTSFCDDDLSQRRWRVKNPNGFTVEVTYEVVGDASQTTVITATPGDTFFYTQARGGANTVKIYWKDQTGTTKSKVKAASNQQCNCQLSYELTTTDVSCADPNSGGIQLQIDGGSGNYRYAWSNGATTQNLERIPAGTYTVTVTDRGTQESCVITQETEVRPLAPAISLSVVSPPSCATATDARISSTISGGQAPYTYQWSSGQTTVDANNLSAGDYTLTVTDAQGCEASQTVEVLAPNQPCQVVSPLILISLCDDDLSQRRWQVKNPNGFNVDVTYEVVDDATQTSAITAATGDTFFYTQDVGGGNSVKIYWEDETGTQQSAVEVASNQRCGCQLSYEVAAKKVNCNDPNSGGIQLQINEGSGNYRYAWSNGATTQNLTNVPVGTYSVTVTDRGTQANCVITQEVTVGSTAPQMTLTLDSPLSCAEATDAQLSSTVVGGVAPYDYQWSNGQTTANIGDLVAGEYTLAVTDAQGCTITQVIEIVAPAEPCRRVMPLTLVSACDDDPTLRQWTVTNPNNFSVEVTYQVVGDANEAATTMVAASGDASVSTPQTEAGTTLRISWQDEQGQIQTAEGVSTDTQCTCTLAYTLSPGEADCDTDRGTITLVVTAGSGSYQYAWSNGATTQNLINVPAGTYSVTVTDLATQASCAITQEAALVASDLAVTLSVENELSCQTGSDGSIRSQVRGGEAPYTYRWNTGEASATLNGLVAGTYVLTVTDANGCQATQEITLVAPDEACRSVIPLQLTTACEDDPEQRRWKISNPNSFSVEVTYELEQASSPTATLSAQSGDTYFNTTTVAGENTVIIRWSDAAEQTASATASGVYQRCTCALTYNLVPTNPSCGSSSGSINLNVTEGSGNYRYAWSHGATTQNVTNLPAGTYSVTVTDQGTEENCEVTREVTLREQTPTVQLTVDRTPSCQSALDGRISSAVSGGQSPYTYTWITGATGTQLNSVGAGTYTLTVTDAAGCQVRESVTIARPAQACDDQLILSFRPTDVSCDDDDNGSAVLDIRGGSGSYRYTWSTGATTKNINRLPAGTYSVTVTDASNPTVSQTGSVTIRQQHTPEVSVQTSATALCGGGSATLTAQGGSGSYLWSPGGQTTAQISVTQPGSYSVALTQGGCRVTSAPVSIAYQPADVQIISSKSGLCEGEEATLTSTAPEGNVWSTGETSRSIVVRAAGTYSVRLQTSGCGAVTASQTIEANDASVCDVPIKDPMCEPVAFRGAA